MGVTVFSGGSLELYCLGCMYGQIPLSRLTASKQMCGFLYLTASCYLVRFVSLTLSS